MAGPFRLVVVAVDSFLSLPALPSQQNAARVIDLLRPCGAKVNGPPEATDTVSVRSLLESWADDSTEPTSALLYWVGHGDSNGEDLSLLTSDSKAPYRESNSIKGRELAERVIDHWELTGANPDDWTFIVLDCCNGAVGAANILNTLTARPERRPGRVAVLAVSSEGASTAGRFADALTAAMDSFTENDESISLRDLFDSVAERTGADYSTIGSFHRITITNPRHSPAVLTVGMDQLGEWRRRLQDFDPDIRNHFLAKAQGTEVGELAWNFAGRSAETRRIVRWLRDAPSGMFIVTGEPGAGKSALLGRLVSLADEGVRAALQHVGLLPESPAEEVPPAGVFDVVVQLTGKTFGDAVRSIDAGSDLEAVMASLRALGRRFTILFDALDEAQDPQRIAARLLVPLSKLPNVRLVLGTRRSLLEGPDLPQATSAELLDALDAGNAEVLVLAREPAAMLDYVRHRLTTLAPDVVDQVTRRLAQVDQPFLFARLVTSELLQTDGAVDIDRLVAGSHGDVFGLAVEAIWQTSPATVALLRALSIAAGRGLPRLDRVWATVAEAIDPTVRVTEDMIDDALAIAARFITLDGEGGQSVYRLAHKTFAEHFHASMDLTAEHLSVATALRGTVREPDGWASANLYVVRHLLDHGARNLALVESTVTDAGYLVAALDALGLDPLVEVLRRASAATSSMAVAAVAGALHRSRVALSQEPAQLVTQLRARLAADGDVAVCRLVEGLDATAPPSWLRAISTSLSWRSSIETTQTFSKKVRALSFAVVDGETILLVGSGDRLILWNPQGGSLDRDSLANDGERITALAAGTCNGESVAALGASYDGTLSVRSLPDGALRWRVDGVSMGALGIGSIEGCEVVIGIDEQRSTIRRWDAASGEELGGEQLAIFGIGRNDPAALRFTSRGLLLLAVSDGALVLHSLERGVAPSLSIGARGVACVDLADIDGRLVLAVGAWDSAGAALLWDADTGSPYGSPIALDFSARTIALGSVGEGAIVAAGNDSDHDSGYVHIGDPHAIRPERSGIWSTRSVWIFARLGNELVGLVTAAGVELRNAITGEIAAISPELPTVDRIFSRGSSAVGGFAAFAEVDPGGLVQLRQPLKKPGSSRRRAPTRRITTPKVDRVRDLRRDTPDSWPTTAATYGVINGAAVHIAGSYSGVVWVRDLDSGHVVAGPFANVAAATKGSRIRAKPGIPKTTSVSFLATSDGHSLIATACRDVVRVWDVTTGEALPVPQSPGLRTDAVALGSAPGHQVLLARGSPGGAVSVWDVQAQGRLAGITLDAAVVGLWFVHGEPTLVVLTQDGFLHVLELVLTAEVSGESGAGGRAVENHH